MAIDSLVFDFDGLILDTELPHYLTIKAEFEAHGVELRLDEWHSIIGRADGEPWLDWLERTTGTAVEREIVAARQVEVKTDLILRNEVLPGVLELLDEADTLGVPAAVASSSSRPWVVDHLDRLGLMKRFAVVCTREDVERAKPWPDLFLTAVAAMDGTPAGAVAFEDSHNGARAAVDAGLFCVVAPNEVTRTQDFTHADLVVDSLADVSLAHLAALVEARPPR